MLTIAVHLSLWWWSLRSLDLRLWKFQIESQRIGKAIGEVDQSHQHIELDNRSFIEVFFQRRDIGMGNLPWRAGELFSVG